MKITKYQRAGLVLNPAMPKLDNSSLQFTSPADMFGSQIGAQNQQEDPQYQLKSKWRFGPNFDHIANSELLQSIGSFISKQRSEQDFKNYNRTQSNPLYELPHNPNTSHDDLYGQTYMKKGGKKQQGGKIDDKTHFFAYNETGAMGNNNIVDLSKPSSLIGPDGKPVITYNYRTSDNKQGVITKEQLDNYKKQYGYKPGNNKTFYGSNTQKGTVDAESQFFANGGMLTPEQHMYLGEMAPNGDNHYFQSGGPTPSKAAEMLHDGTAQGHKLTDKQRRYFGWLSNQKMQLGGDYASYDTPGINARQSTSSVNYANLNANQKFPDSSGIAGLLNNRDASNDFLSTGKMNKSLTGNVPTDYLNYLYLFNQRQDVKNLSPDQKINMFYNSNPDNPNAASQLKMLKGLPNSSNRPTPNLHFQYGGISLDDEMEKDIMGDENQTQQNVVESAPQQEQAQNPQEEQVYEDIERNPYRFFGNTSYQEDQEDSDQSDTSDEQGDYSIPEMGAGSNRSPLEQFKKGIAKSEGADYFTGNKGSSAYGKYQILKGTRENIREQFFPNVSKKDFEDSYKTNPKFQEAVMDAYGSHLLKSFGDPHKAALAFFLGPGKANMTDQPNYRPTPNNSTVGEYLSHFDKGYKFRLGGAPNKKFYEQGGYYMVDNSEIEKLKKGGYQVEVY